MQRSIRVSTTVAAGLLCGLLSGLAQAQPQPMPPPASPAPPPGYGGGYAPAPGYPPPGYYRPMPMTRYSRYRTHWYIGFALGGGAGWMTTDSGYSSNSEGGVAVTALKVGAVITPWFLLGVEAAGWRHQEENVWLQFNHYDVMATIFPIYDAGLLVKGGLGAGVALSGFSGSYGSYAGVSQGGFDAKFGVGYEWQLLTSFNLGVELDYALTAYDGGKTHDLCGLLSLTWY